MIRQAALYLATADDRHAALLSVAGHPVAFRALIAAVRAGATRVGVPAVFRGTSLERAIAASPRAGATAVWLDTARLEPAATLLVPAAALTPPAALAILVASPAPAVVAASAHEDAPAVAADATMTAALRPALGAGAPVGDDLRRALKARDTLALAPDAWYVRVRDAGSARTAETHLFATLGSAIDTRLDRALHRPLSRHVTRAALALGVTPNQISVASLVVGLSAAWCVWNGSAIAALAGLLVYVAAVVLDHTDGEVARLRLAESALGEWLDILVDTVVHAALVVAMGLTAQTLTGHGAALGVIGAVGVIASAVVAKIWPVTGTTTGMGATLENLGSRDGFYAMLVLFIAARAFAPRALPLLMIVVALGSHAYWVARGIFTLTRR